MTSVRIMLVVTVAAVVAGFVPAVAAGNEPGPIPVDDLSRFESATVSQASSVSITVDRRGVWLRAGRKATYMIRVENHGENPEVLTVRVSLPPWLTEVAAGDGAEVSDGSVAWSATVAPAAVITRRITGTYTRPGRDELAAGPVRAALTACVLDAEGNQPIICATDIAELRTSRSVLPWLLIAAAAVVVVAGLAVVLLRRYQRKRSAIAAIAAIAAGPTGRVDPPR